jgi:hypothetical protein
VTPHDRYREVINYLHGAQKGPNGKVYCRCPMPGHTDDHQSAVLYPPNDRGALNMSCSVCGPLDGRMVAAMLGFDPALLRGSSFRAVDNRTTTFGPRPEKKRAIEFTPPEDAALHGYRCHVAALQSGKLAELAKQLGVTKQSLRALGAGYCEGDQTATAGGVIQYGPHYTFPELAGVNLLTVGICRRFLDGSKRSREGDGRGLYVPEGVKAEALRRGYCLAVEGASDTAACYSMNIPAIGRPGNNSGHDHLAAFFRELGVTVVVVGENDRKENGDWPGRDGAIQTATKLRIAGVKACAVMVPEGVKDTRSWLQSRGFDPENLAIGYEAGKDYLKSLTEIDGAYPCEISGIHREEYIAEKSHTECNSIYEPGLCPCPQTIFQRGKADLSLELRSIMVRCGKAGCEECLPVRRLHWFNMLAGYTLDHVDSLYYVEYPEDELINTIRMRVKRAGGMFAHCECETKTVVFSTVELPGSVKITGIHDLVEKIHAAIASVDLHANRPVDSSRAMKPDKAADKKETDWETIGSASGDTFFAFKHAAQMFGLKPIPGNARGEAVMGTATFRLRAEWSLAERTAIVAWLMLGICPPPNDPFRMPTLDDVNNSGPPRPKRRGRRKAVPT